MSMKKLAAGVFLATQISLVSYASYALLWCHNPKAFLYFAAIDIVSHFTYKRVLASLAVLCDEDPKGGGASL